MIQTTVVWLMFWFNLEISNFIELEENSMPHYSLI